MAGKVKDTFKKIKKIIYNRTNSKNLYTKSTNNN